MADETTNAPGTGSNGDANTVPVPVPTVPQPTPTSPSAPAPLEQQSQPPTAQGATPVKGPVLQPGQLGGDIAKILQTIKLPERRDVPGAAKKQIENKAAAFDTELGAVPTADAPAATRTPLPAPPIATQNTGTSSSNVVAVHTLKDDLQQVVQDQKMSVVRAVSLEEDRRTREKEQERFGTPPPPQAPKRIFGILLAVVIFGILGAGALFGVYTVMQSTNVPQTSTGPSLLFAESSVALPLDNRSPDTLKQQLAGARTSLRGALGSITAIVPTVSTVAQNGAAAVQPATFSQFMAAIGAKPPGNLLRALGDNFFFGIHTVDINAPLLVVPVLSYDNAFAGMLAWEATMNTDLAPVFTAVPAMMTDSNGLPAVRTFQDDVKQNYDVRELKDDGGQVRLYYSFPTQNVLVIAESPYSFAEILSRLQAEQKL